MTFISCNGEKFNINEDVAFENKIGFVTSETRNFVQMNKEQIANNWKAIFELDNSVKFTDFRVIKGQYADTGNEYYLLKTISDNGTIRIATKLTVDKDSKRMIMGKKTCKCESVSCAWSSCDASYSDDRCVCSSCSSSCKKTSIVTNDLTHSFSDKYW